MSFPYNTKRFHISTTSAANSLVAVTTIFHYLSPEKKHEFSFPSCISTFHDKTHCRGELDKEEGREEVVGTKPPAAL